MILKENVLDLLQNESLCFLATCKENEPYVSLMNFTYDEGSQRIILSSRRDSKKYKNILINNKVSLLFHNDYQNSSGEIISVTINGKAVQEKGDDEEYYRNIHAIKHQKRRQFIIGHDIGILSITIDKMIISDINDKVTLWENH